MFERIKKRILSLSRHDAIVGGVVGLIIAAVFQPFLVAFVTDIYVGVGAPGYKAPSIETEFSQGKESFEPGSEVIYFENLTWKSEYQLYRVKIDNNGDQLVRDLKVTVPLPGCVEHVNTEGPAVQGDYDIEDTITARMSGSGLKDSPIEPHQCSKVIQANFLDPGESITVEFIVTDKFEKCDLLNGIPDNPDIITTYRWSVSNSVYKEVEYNRDTELWSKFTEFTQHQQGKGMFMDMVENRRYGAFLVTDQESMKQGMERCGATIGR
ncbi:hypothetical protein [Halomarina rubra]|uniref:DUF11 domain-containing protein n=1 Tax=Halomarina rubra TaxID=2071873 RepID=A0ABD6AQD5_9EURY|nr:hypothetical protein [Halomarina rubra]